VARGIINQDDFYTVGSLIDIGVIVIALIGNRIRSKSLYQPFFAVHVSFLIFNYKPFLAHSDILFECDYRSSIYQDL
jgi:hypothetical protein